MNLVLKQQPRPGISLELRDSVASVVSLVLGVNVGGLTLVIPFPQELGTSDFNTVEFSEDFSR